MWQKRFAPSDPIFVILLHLSGIRCRCILSGTILRYVLSKRIFWIISILKYLQIVKLRGITWYSVSDWIKLQRRLMSGWIKLLFGLEWIIVWLDDFFLAWFNCKGDYWTENSHPLPIVQFFEHCSNGLWPPLVLNMYVAKSFEQLLEKCVNLCCDKIQQNNA